MTSVESGTGGFRHYVMGFVLLPRFSWITRPSISFDGSSAEPAPRDLGLAVTLFASPILAGVIGPKTFTISPLGNFAFRG